MRMTNSHGPRSCMSWNDTHFLVYSKELDATKDQTYKAC